MILFILRFIGTYDALPFMLGYSVGVAFYGFFARESEDSQF
jgi:hypothetical protein